MGSGLFEISTRNQCLEYIKKREITKLIEHLNAIKENNQSQILLDTGELKTKKTGYTILSYAIKHRTHECVIKKLLEIAEEAGILKELLKIKYYYRHTILSLAIRNNSNPEIIKLLLKKEQETGLTTQIFYERSVFEKLFERHMVPDSMIARIESGDLNTSKQGWGYYTNVESPRGTLFLTHCSEIIKKLNHEQLTQALNASNTEVLNPGIPSSSSNILSDLYIVDDKVVTVGSQQNL